MVHSQFHPLLLCIQAKRTLYFISSSKLPGAANRLLPVKRLCTIVGQLYLSHRLESAKPLQRSADCPASRMETTNVHRHLSRLWLYVPHTKGVCCYDPNAKEWFSFPGEKEITNELITAVIDDGKGNIWIGTDNKGIYISYHQDGKGYERLSKEVDNPFSLPNNHICCFYKDHSDIMWVGTSKLGATFTSLHNVTFETCRLPQQEDVSCLVEDKDGNLWLGFDGEGLAYYDRKKTTILSFRKTGCYPFRYNCMFI